MCLTRYKIATSRSTASLASFRRSPPVLIVTGEASHRSRILMVLILIVDRMGRPYNEPVNHLSYVENFLYMLDHLQVGTNSQSVPIWLTSKVQEKDYRPHPKLVRALEVLFILHGMILPLVTSEALTSPTPIFQPTMK